MAQINPLTIRDFRQGRATPSAINNFLAPINSVQHSINVNFDQIIGSAVVRAGCTPLGSAVALGKIPLGFTEFVPAIGVTATPRMVAVYTGATQATAYYFDGSSWAASGLTTLNNTAKCRFAALGGRLFIANGQQAMQSSADGNTWTTTDCMTTRVPSLLMRAKGRMLASGDSGFPSRVWFSSIINPVASPFITWAENTTTGDFIDINPDDGSNITGFSETSSVVLVFKTTGMYRLNVVSKTVDTQNIFNIGAVSQEAIVQCQGITYFFSGQDIRRTDGSYPEQISRIGVQDIIDAIPQANWSSVAAGTDGLNVYFSIGDVTLNTNQDNQYTITNCVLKFSPRDESWSVHSYRAHMLFFAQYTTSANGRLMYEADNSGFVQAVNLGTTDATKQIYYELVTQEIDFGNRASTKKIADKFVCFTNYGQDGQIQIQADQLSPYTLPIDLDQRVAVSKDLNFEGNYFTVRWFGWSKNKAPILEGFMLTDITDQGITK